MKKVINAPENVVTGMLWSMEKAHTDLIRVIAEHNIVMRVGAPVSGTTKAVDGGAGVFYVIKNYTGVVLNFEMAGELAEAEGIETDYVVTNDLAVEDSTFTSGRRKTGRTSRGSRSYIAYSRVADVLERAGKSVFDMTWLEMAGLSVTLLKSDEELKGYLTAPCSVAAGRPF